MRSNPRYWGPTVVAEIIIETRALVLSDGGQWNAYNLLARWLVSPSHSSKECEVLIRSPLLCVILYKCAELPSFYFRCRCSVK